MKPTALVLFNAVRACAWLGSGPIPAHAFFVCNRKETIFPTYPFGNVGNNAILGLKKVQNIFKPDNRLGGSTYRIHFVLRSFVDMANSYDRSD